MIVDFLVGELTIRFINDAEIANNMFQTQTHKMLILLHLFITQLKGWHQLLFDYRKNV
jgi:hypothetical protein